MEVFENVLRRTIRGAENMIELYPIPRSVIKLRTCTAIDKGSREGILFMQKIQFLFLVAFLSISTSGFSDEGISEKWVDGWIDEWEEEPIEVWKERFPWDADLDGNSDADYPKKVYESDSRRKKYGTSDWDGDGKLDKWGVDRDRDGSPDAWVKDEQMNQKIEDWVHGKCDATTYKDC